MSHPQRKGADCEIQLQARASVFSVSSVIHSVLELVVKRERDYRIQVPSRPHRTSVTARTKSRPRSVSYE